MADQYDVWRQNLRGTAHDPQLDQNICGFWRIATVKTKPDTPVAIWPAMGADGKPTGRQVLKVGRLGTAEEGSKAWHDFIAWAWPKCTPVMKEAYDFAIQRGVWLVDGKASRNLTPEEITGITEPKEGDTNSPPVADLLADQIVSLADIIAEAPQPETQDQANALQGRVDRMAALLNMAERKRVEEKEPHLNAGRAVDAKWKAIAQPGEAVLPSAKLKRAAFLRVEQARLDEEARVEREQQLKAARERAAEIAKNAPPEEAKLVEHLAEKMVPEVKPETARVGSGAGRAVGLKTVRRGVVDDPKKMIDYLLESGDVGIIVYCAERAQAVARMPDRSRALLPGMHVEEDKT